MPASNVLSELVLSMIDYTVAEDRVHVGSRLQSGALPAVVIEQLASERATIGSGAISSGAISSLVRHQWKLSAIASDMIAARSLASNAANYAVFNMGQSGYVTFRTSEAIVEEPQSGEGDEQQPAVASLTLETLFPE